MVLGVWFYGKCDSSLGLLICESLKKKTVKVWVFQELNLKLAKSALAKLPAVRIELTTFGL